MTGEDDDLGYVAHRRLWPSDLFHARHGRHDELRDELVEIALARRAAQGEASTSGVAIAAKAGLFESAFDVVDDPSPAVQVLHRYLGSLVDHAARMVDGDGLSADIVESWFHVTEPGGFHDYHLHGSADWCAVYCIDTGAARGEGAINRWYRPFAGKRRACFDAVLGPGEVIVFPGHLAHAALPHPGPGVRIVLALNAVLRSVAQA